jgi:hypothetical protein
MIEVIAEFDAWTAAQYPLLTQKLWGYTEIVHKTEAGSDQPMPVTINNTSDRQQVSLDDRYELETWFRLPGTIELQNEVDGNDWAFGLQQGIVQRPTLRWVIAHRVEIGDNWIFDFLQNIPSSFKIPGYQITHIDRNALTLDADHENIYLTELGKTVYEKHRFTWNLYVINLAAEYILCPTANLDLCCTDSLLTEAGACIIAQNDDCLIEE